MMEKRTGRMGVNKDHDKVLRDLIDRYVGDFTQKNFRDEALGIDIPYNLFLPGDYNTAERYPLVMFIGDASTVGDDLLRPLTQGYGGLVWVTDEWQAHHPCIVAVPQYGSVVLDDHGAYTISDYVEGTKHLLDELISKYAVDANRIYGTGQSMGCMTTLVLAARYPELYAACVFVDGQWDAETLAPLAKQTFIMFAAGGDDKALGGMRELIPVLMANGAEIGEAEWDARSSAAELNAAAEKLFCMRNAINCVTWKTGSVLPDPLPEHPMEHMYSFDPAYKVSAVREWVFEQSR